MSHGAGLHAEDGLEKVGPKRIRRVPEERKKALILNVRVQWIGSITLLQSKNC